MISLDTAARINFLLHQLSEKAKDQSIPDLKRILGKRDVFSVGAFDNGILVGMNSIHFKETLMRKAGIIENPGDTEDVVVDKEYRGRGIARKLNEILIKEARKRKVDCIDLTSNSSRTEAIAMYESMGFEKRDTNCYRLSL
jgi:ribosomal protein S18 acetylase RimI-like enzyme